MLAPGPRVRRASCGFQVNVDGVGQPLERFVVVDGVMPAAPPTARRAVSAFYLRPELQQQPVQVVR